MLPLLPLFVILPGSYFIFKTGILTPKRLKASLRCLFKKNGEDGVSPLSALTVALAGTLGVGNIVGVAVAITLGGAGAVLWMWVCAFFSMGLKYAETVLAVRYRCQSGKGGTKNKGGPMYYIFYGLGKKRLSCLFCALCICSSLASGCVIQSNSAAAALTLQYGVPPLLTGVVFAVLCGVIVIGGIGSISRFTSALIPFMTAVFLAVSLGAIFSDLSAASSAFGQIFACAFQKGSIGGGIAGAGIAAGIKHGMAKSALSHEAGAGTSPISHAASNTKSPVEQGFLGIFEVFADTVVMCTVTAVVILMAYPRITVGDPYDGMYMTSEAYGAFFGTAAHHIITVAVAFFAFATLICWSYYGVCCVEYLTKDKRFSSLYLLLYCLCITAGAVVKPQFVWEMTDFFTCALIFLNVPVIFALRGEVISETEKYYSSQ